MRLITLVLLGIGISTELAAQPCARPFPQHVKYAAGSIKPSHVSQPQMDNTVRAFYTAWRKMYIRNTGCAPGQSFVWTALKNKHQCVSEGQGYGMLITALMAGYDKEAKTTFDALYQYYAAHPTKPGQHLMAWAQDKKCKSSDASAATDGDMDIAYALLLANKQWGSKGAINYLLAAKTLLSDIMRYEVNRTAFTLLLANGIDPDGDDYFDTRPSDFMPDHLRAFAAVTKDARWNKVIDNTYALFKQMQAKYSPDAGLVPDFIQRVKGRYKPARPHYLEASYDGFYNYNACRVPWRIATDHLLYADPRAKAMCTRINHWLRETTQNKPDNISAGYTLAGDDIKDAKYEALCFIGPFAASAMVDAGNQQWLNHLWDYLNSFKMTEFGYYDNTIKMINLILISGNYWGA